MLGNDLMRRPVAWYTALAMAAEQTLEDVEFEHEFAQGYQDESDEGEDGFLHEQQMAEQQTNAIAEGDFQAWAAG